MTAASATDDRPPPRWPRWLLAGPLVFVVAGLVMGGGALWLPPGPAQINNIVLPIVSFPAIWAALFFYGCLDRKLPRAYAVVLGLGLLHALLIAAHLLG